MKPENKDFNLVDFMNEWYYIEKYAWDDTTEWYEAMQNEGWFD